MAPMLYRHPRVRRHWWQRIYFWRVALLAVACAALAVGVWRW